jgi:prepilin signal peptidase PulO-like enzyme (type II secretory pathway)
MAELLAALGGLLFGHVLDLAFVRFYTSEDPATPLHHCPACRSPFRARFAVPLAGYVMSLGRCPDCRAFLPLRSLVLPLGGAALFATSVAVFGDAAPAIAGGVFATLFLTLTLTDLERRLLPNRVIYPAIGLAIALSWVWPDASVVEIIAGGLAGLALGLGLLLASLPFGKGAFGLGDVKMIALIGFVVGPAPLLVGVLLGSLIAGLLAATLLFMRLRRRSDYLPHGPFLALGAVIALFWGPELWEMYRG